MLEFHKFTEEVYEWKSFCGDENLNRAQAVLIILLLHRHTMGVLAKLTGLYRPL